MPHPRRVLGVVIVAFWVVMTAWLARREMATTRLEAAPAGGPSSMLMGIFLDDGPRVGTLHWAQTPEIRDDTPGMAWSARVALELHVLGNATKIELSGDAWQSDTGDRATFGFDVASGADAARLEGTLEDGLMRADAIVGGETVSFEQPLDGQLVASAGFGAPLRLPGLEVGRSYRVTSFDPLSMGLGTARLRCTARETRMVAGQEIETWVVAIDAGGLEARAWVDADGQVVRAETPVGLIFERVAEDDDQVPRSGDAVPTPDWLARTAVVPRGLLPRRGARSMTVRVRGLEESEIPVDDRQEDLGDNVFRFTVSDRPGSDGSATEPGPAFAPWLAAEPFVQRDHPEIQAAAQVATGESSGAWARASALYEWVYRTVEKDVALGLPSALEVLRGRRGDCNEHTVLYTALARAVGVPTRIAIGLVWSDELEGFYYHAWPEVWAGHWVALDPTLGQPVADATHIKLLEGGIEAWPRLLRFLGRIELEVLEVE